jgi:hypothetical protein
MDHGATLTATSPLLPLVSSVAWELVISSLHHLLCYFDIFLLTSSTPCRLQLCAGCDALNTICICISVSCAFQFGPSLSYWLVCSVVYLTFFAAQWEEYLQYAGTCTVSIESLDDFRFHTQILELGLINVTEGQLIYMGVMIITYFEGAHRRPHRQHCRRRRYCK